MFTYESLIALISYLVDFKEVVYGGAGTFIEAVVHELSSAGFLDILAFKSELFAHPLSVFRPEDSPEERNRFRWDFGSPEDLPVRFYQDSLFRWKERPHRKDSGEKLYDSGGNQ